MIQESIQTVESHSHESVKNLLWNNSIIDHKDKTNAFDTPEPIRVNRFEPVSIGENEGIGRREMLQSPKWDKKDTTSFWLSYGSDGNNKNLQSPITLQEKLSEDTRIISTKERNIKSHGDSLRETKDFSGDSIAETTGDFENTGPSFQMNHRTLLCMPLSAKDFDSRKNGMQTDICEGTNYKNTSAKIPKQLGSPEDHYSCLTIDCEDLLASTTAGLMFLGTDEIGEFQLAPFLEDEFESDAPYPSTPSNRAYIRKLITKIISPRNSPSSVDDERQLACYWAFAQKQINHHENDRSCKCNGEDEISSIDQDMTVDKPLLQDQATMIDDMKNKVEQDEEHGQTQEKGLKWWSTLAWKNDSSRPRQVPQTLRVPVFQSIPSLSHTGHHMAISFKKELTTPRRTFGKKVSQLNYPHAPVFQSMINQSHTGHDVAFSFKDEFTTPKKGSGKEMVLCSTQKPDGVTNATVEGNVETAVEYQETVTIVEGLTLAEC